MHKLILILSVVLRAMVPTLSTTEAQNARGTAAAAIVARLSAERAGDDRLEDVAARARLLLVLAREEGDWNASPVGWNDGGAACGVGQVHAADWAPILGPGYSCAAMRASLEVGLDGALVVLRWLEGRCGSLGGAVHAYAVGRCPSGALHPIAVGRCLRAGLTAWCGIID